MYFNLNLIQDIKDFVNIASKYEGPIILKSGVYEVDAKSLLGILSLDLTKSVELKQSPGVCTAFLEEVRRFAV